MCILSIKCKQICIEIALRGIFIEKGFTCFSNFDFVQKFWNGKVEYHILFAFSQTIPKLNLNGVKIEIGNMIPLSPHT